MNNHLQKDKMLLEDEQKIERKSVKLKRVKTTTKELVFEKNML